MRPAAPLLAAALVLGACVEKDSAPEQAAPAAEVPATPAPEATAPRRPNIPEIYMAVQPDPGGATSVIFAIDQTRDGSPMDDAAIRLTPEDGKCNPQELRRYNFPIDRAEQPAFGPEDAEAGITARDLPNFMAMAVTSEMLRLGLVANPDESQPQNVCSRKLWEQLILNESVG
ncbi:MAG: hypothetical protein AAF409_01920 [Pseudomonadota bacterium]